MPRIRKPKCTHVFIMDYPFAGIKEGTRCSVIREFPARDDTEMVEVKLENGEDIDCYKYRIAPIERN